MVTVGEFTIPPDAFPFGHALAKMPEMEITVDQIVPTDESAFPFFWVRGCRPEAFMEYAERENAVRGTRLLEQVGEVALFRAEWRPNAELIKGLQELDVTIVNSVGTAEHWRFKVRAQDRTEFRKFQSVFENQGIPVDLIRLYDLEELLAGTHRSLTTAQRETLLTAYQQGYFETPRMVTQAELSESFDISRRAVSDRLRRGMRNLIADTLLPSSGPDSNGAE